MPRPISASISLPSLRHNLEVVTQHLEQTGSQACLARPNIWAVIKANAYGHGVANALQAFDQAEGLAMLDLDEAVICREQGWTKPILLLEGFFEERDIAVMDEYGLAVAIHCQEQLDMLRSAGIRSPLNAYIKLNTGMNRLGFSRDDYRGAFQQAQAASRQGLLGEIGKMTHFARADDDPPMTQLQLQEFQRVVKDLPGSTSVCNSAATLSSDLWATVPCDQDQWVRPGICLYGSTPFASKPASEFGLRPAMTLASKLISVRNIEIGAAVGYGHIFVASTPMRIGVVACGYADGYPRHAGTGTPVTVDGIATQLLGRVSMDMLVVDLTHVPHAAVNSPVILWGEGGPSVDDVAHAAGTIGYELLCAVAPRVPKIIV